MNRLTLSHRFARVDQPQCHRAAVPRVVSSAELDAACLGVQYASLWLCRNCGYRFHGHILYGGNWQKDIPDVKLKGALIDAGFASTSRRSWMDHAKYRYCLLLHGNGNGKPGGAPQRVVCVCGEGG